VRHAESARDNEGTTVIRRFPRTAALALALGCDGTAEPAQDVHKCVQGDRVVYQDKPCPGVDRLLQIHAGPDADQVDAARGRAQAEKDRAGHDASSSAPAGAGDAAASRTPANAPKV
jgi:hypothetical protein